MLRVCLTALIVTISACATAQGPTQIRVTGAGKTFEAAKENAFKHAVQEAVGNVLVAEVELNNGALTRDEILSHSSGYVERYTILSKNEGSDLVMLEMNVWVNNSKIANRILGKSRDVATIDGQNHSVQHSTYVQQQNTGDELLYTVLRDHPYRAYNIYSRQPEMRVDYNRNAVLRIPYSIRWNPNYLASLSSALEAVEIKPRVKGFGEYFYGIYEAQNSGKVRNGDMSSYEFTAKTTAYGAVMIGPSAFDGRKFNISDVIQMRALMSAFSDENTPLIKVTIYDHANNIRYQACHAPEATFYVGNIAHSRKLNLLTNDHKKSGEIDIVISNSTSLQNMIRSELTIVAAKNCPR
jgi:hypothetical protein